MGIEDNNKNDSTGTINYAYKYWISFEVRNTTTDRSRRFNTTFFLSRKPKNESDIQAVQELLKTKVLTSKLQNFSLDEKNIQVTILSWPHFISKMDVSKIPTHQTPLNKEPSPQPTKPKSKFTVIDGGKVQLK